jgi:hypothetical protein
MLREKRKLYRKLKTSFGVKLNKVDWGSEGAYSLSNYPGCSLLFLIDRYTHGK